jgi:outer membrane receptor protein involved in Fe transport
MLRKLLSLILIGAVFSVFAQDRPGELRGTIKDSKSGETLPFANVVVKQDGAVITGTTTDFDGKYIIKPLSPGRYVVEASFQGYAVQPVEGVIISPNKITTLDFSLTKEAELLGEVEVIEYVVPLIDPDKQGKTTTQEEIQNIPQRDVASIASTSAGVYQSDDGAGINVRGSRSDATDVYIDGMKVIGSSALPQAGIDQMTIITGGLPAQYGDATGGIISITTRGPSQRFFGGVEYSTSELFDKYGWNLIGLSFSGPLAKKDDGTVIAGYFLSGEAHFQRDADPSAIGMTKVKDDVLADLEANPLSPAAFGNGTIKNAEFLREQDLENIKYKQNTRRTDYRVQGKFDFRTGRNTNLTIGGSLSYTNRHGYIYTYSLLNPSNNPLITRNSWRVFGRFQQRFVDADDESSSSNVRNAFYSIQVDYTQDMQTTEDDSHKDRLFDYGYVGEFNTYKRRVYSYGTDSVTGLTGWLQAGFQDTAVTFDRSEINANTANYTSQVYDFFNGTPANLAQIQQAGGLLNGMRPPNVYSLYFNTGRQYNGYQVINNSQFRITGSGSADIKGHSIILGFEYEQRFSRFYGASPIGLWGLARQLANLHILELDLTNPYPVYDENGVFLDTVNYDRLYNANTQTFFDKNVRAKLGLAENSTDWLDIDAYNPDFFDIGMFSADELLNEGNSFVNYYGYDHTGNKTSGGTDIDAFFSERDENGNYKRSIGTFEPIYMAGYIQDKFAFNDILFNVGVRVDRFDANQVVLKDPFSLFPTVSTAEAFNSESPYYLGGDNVLPANIGDDFVPYVDNLTEPNLILGYRDGFQWYNAQGDQISDPQILADGTTTGQIAPYLVDPVNTSPRTDLTGASFTDYTPQINVMPRIAFNFPISDEAMFFAHYDILTQRPAGALRLDPTDYLFAETVQGAVWNNPNLKPERTVDYEVGFKQTLSKRSAITISAFYRELRDMIQITNILYAYPVSYLTYGNIDFGTVKGFSVSYDLRRSGNVTLNANYTLQFADGTGSSATSGFSLVNSGQPNLRVLQPLSFDQRHTFVMVVDYRYGDGDNYNGPVWGGKKVFANAGANFSFRLGSGTPYSAQANATQDAAFGIPTRPIFKGTINGSRRPWQFRVDMRLNKQFDVNLGKEVEGQRRKKGSVNIYLEAQNLLNTKNVIGVYRFTGNPDDDGWLASNQAQEVIKNQLDSQSYIDLYSQKVNNPNNYSLPRRMRLGVQFNF